MLTKEMTATISNVLSNMGCKESYIFGSHVTGNANDFSDIDIGIKGLPPQKFFALLQNLGELRKIIEHL